MGAILGALVRGKAATAPRLKRKGTLPAKAPVPSITDVDFMALHAIVIDGVTHNVIWREEEVLALLTSTDEAALEFHDESFALQMQYADDNGFPQDAHLPLGLLRELRWDSEQGEFVSSKGRVFRFVFEVSAADWFRVHTPKGLAQSYASSESKAARQVEAGAWRLFSVEGEFKARKGSEKTIAKTRVAAPDAASAPAYVKDIWDNTHAALHVTKVAPEKESVAGPFSVYVDGGFYDKVPYLEQAVSLAEMLHSEASDEVSIEDNASNCIWRLLADNEDSDES
jgi:hypothetical protein